MGQRSQGRRGRPSTPLVGRRLRFLLKAVGVLCLGSLVVVRQAYSRARIAPPAPTGSSELGVPGGPTDVARDGAARATNPPESASSADSLGDGIKPTSTLTVSSAFDTSPASSTGVPVLPSPTPAGSSTAAAVSSVEPLTPLLPLPAATSAAAAGPAVAAVDGAAAGSMSYPRTGLLVFVVDLERTAQVVDNCTKVDCTCRYMICPQADSRKLANYN